MSLVHARPIWLPILLLVLQLATRPFCLAAAAGAPPITQAAVLANDIRRFTFELERMLDVSKRPCRDFYNYVCGRSVNSTQAQLDQRLQHEQMKFDKFLAADNDEQLLDAELKLKQFYDSCKNARSLEDLKSSLMYRLTGGWPAVDSSRDALLRKHRNTTWMGVLSAFHDVGQEYFFQQLIEIKSNKRVVHLRPDFSMRYTLRKFEQLAGEVMQEYAVDPGRARLVTLEILNFERSRRDIVKAELTSDEQQFSYAEFKVALSGTAENVDMDWDAYFKKTLGKSLKPGDLLLVKQFPKLVQMFELLQNTTMSRFLNWIWIDYLMDKRSSDCQALVQTYFEPVYEHIVERSAVDKVQMAQMYAAFGRAYDELLPPSAWIDEMSQQNSKQFLSRVIHLTLNGDAKLDRDLKSLSLTKRNFYRNLEKAQRYHAEQLRLRNPSISVASNSIAVNQAASDFMKVFLNLNGLLQQQRNLTTPLNYALIGAHFAERMIASGSNSHTPGAWRSMDSEREYAAIKQCIARQTSPADSATSTAYNLNDLILKLLAQHQTLHALTLWQEKDAALARQIDALLAASRLQLTVRKLYYIGMVLASDCRQSAADVTQRELVHALLRNSQEFSKAFGCRDGDDLYARYQPRLCKVL